MSRALFSRNADLAKLREEGYFVQVVGGFLARSRPALLPRAWRVGRRLPPHFPIYDRFPMGMSSEVR